MSLYRLVSGKVLKGNENKSKYLKADLDYLSDVCKQMNFESKDTLDSGYSAVEKLKQGKELEESEARVLAAVFVGDAEWQGAWCTWIKNSYLREIALLSVGHVNYKWKSEAERHYNLRKLEEPQYSRPSYFENNGKTCLKRTENTEDAMMMKTGILQLDWFEYVCEQTQIKHDEELFQKARKETAQYYAGGIEDLTSKVKKIQHHMFENDINWFKKLNQSLGVRAYSIKRAKKIYEKELETNLNLQ